MGKQNRQRRAEKQRQRRRQEVRTPSPPADGGRRKRPDEGVAGRRPDGFTVAQVADLIQLAATPRRGRAHEDRVVVLDALALQSDGPGGPATIDAGLVLASGALLAGLWEDGWQPVDLDRIVAHRSSSTHRSLLVELIARQSLDQRLDHAPAAWRAQLDALGAEVLGAKEWWDGGAPHLEQWAHRSGLAWRPFLEVVAELLGALVVLPGQPRLCPPPSAWSAATALGAGGSGGGLDAKVLTKVRALLAKAESTEFPEEAESLSAKAQELIARHAIDRALLAPDGPTGGAPPGGRRIPVDDPYAAGKAQLLQAVGSANRCRTVWDKAHGFCTVFGYPGDLDAVELLHASLLVQATSAMAAAGSHVDAHGVSRTRSFRSSFLTAFAHRIGERLRRTTDANVAAAVGEQGGDRLLPVLVAREEAVDEVVAEAFPKLVAHQVKAVNRAGWIAGRVAADCAELAVGPRLTDQRRLSA